MSNVTGLLPVAQGVAVYASLHQHAESLRGQGDIRTLAQIMADTFYHRLTGQQTAGGARRIVGRATVAWTRRLNTAPRTDELVAMDGNRRTFSGKLRRLVVLRGQGLCAACNHTKEAPGWRADLVTGREHLVEITTPTGHVYRSHPP